MAINVEKDVLDSVKKKTTTDDTINRFLAENDESFPKASDIQVEFKYSDPFEVPDYCNQKDFAFAWLDPTDDIAMHRALEKEYFRIVTRSSSCFKGKSLDRDFRTHGAIERQRMILGFRPKDLDSKLRTRSVVQHAAITESLSEGKQEEHYSTTFTKGEEDKDSKMDVVAFEEAGEVGIKGA